MKDDFFIKIETWHKPDIGTTENVSVCLQFICAFLRCPIIVLLVESFNQSVSHQFIGLGAMHRNKLIIINKNLLL